MKNLSRVILVHNHTPGSLIPSDTDKDITDRLIQVGRILNIDLIDHLIITPKSYISFCSTKLMDELEQSLKYVPTYQVVERIRKEEKLIAKEKLAVANDKVKVAEEKAKIAKLAEKKEREQKERLVQALARKEVSVEQIAIIMEIDTKEVQKILRKKTVKAQK